MMAAAMNGHTAVVEALLAKGANVQSRRRRGRDRRCAMRQPAATLTSSTCCRRRGQPGAKSELTAGGGRLPRRRRHSCCSTRAVTSRPRVMAVRCCSWPPRAAAWDTVRPLLEKGADVQREGRRPAKTALMVSALAGSREIVQMLLDHGADPNAMDELERTALMFASLSRQDEVRRAAATEEREATGPGDVAGGGEPDAARPINPCRETTRPMDATCRRRSRGATCRPGRAGWRWSVRIRTRATRRRSCTG